MTKGVSISQEGIPVDRAADYQKVLDSRWRFMETEYTVPDTSTIIPAITTTGYNFKQRVMIFPHNLGFVPVFHCDWSSTGSAFGGSFNSVGGIFCDNIGVYFERTIFGTIGNTPEAPTIRLKAKIYNLPAFEEYRSLSEVAAGIGPGKSDIGVKVLDDSDSNVKVYDHSSVGFSVDTQKKVLSVHKVSTKYINSWLFDLGRGTAVNTGTDEFTFTIDPTTSYPSGVSWIVTGVGIDLTPADFVTMPNPLTASVTYYVIKTSDTTFKLALSQALALAGTAINITSSGSLPLFLRRAGTIDDYRVPHETNYPPSYLFCEYVDRVNEIPATLPLFHVSTTPIVSTDNNYLYFGGVQAVYGSKIVYIILKDPVEIAS